MPEHRQQPKWRLLFLVALGTVLVIGAIGYYHFWWSRPIGSGPAGPRVDSTRFAQEWTQRPVMLLGLGDSVTAGFGASPGHSYFQRLIANPPDEYPDLQGINLSKVLPNLRATNLAASGSTSIDQVKMQIRQRLPVVTSNTLALIVVTTGGNDIIHNYGRTPPREGAMYGATFEQAKPWIANFEQRLDLMIRRIEEHFPGGCHVFLATIYDPTDGYGDAHLAGLPRWPDGSKILDAYNEIIRRCPSRHRSVHVVDMRQEFLGHGIHCAQFWAKTYRPSDPHYWYHENLEDPNDRGYDAIRRLFLNAIAEAAKEFK